MPIAPIDVAGYDEVYRFECGPNVVFVALHAVLSGRSFGGTRFQAYPDEAAALADVLALARAMSRKVVMSGIDGGGGKTVIIDRGGDRAATLAAVGAFIEELGGRYRTGSDVGITPADLAALTEATQYVACGDLAAPTAETVRSCMFALSGPIASVAIQGLGAIGRSLAETLLARGIRVVATDAVDVDVAGVEMVAPGAIYDVACDVFAPCAVGGVLDADTIARLRCGIVCGGANNPLKSAEDAERLRARAIRYVPDFIANCGATIVGASRALNQPELIAERMAAVPGRAAAIVDRAEQTTRSPHHVAIDMADARIDELRRAG